MSRPLVQADLKRMDLEQLAQQQLSPDTTIGRMLAAEFVIRQTKRRSGGQATKASAAYAKENVRWMFWSVVVLAVASVASFVLTCSRSWEQVTAKAGKSHGKGRD